MNGEDNEADVSPEITPKQVKGKSDLEGFSVFTLLLVLLLSGDLCCANHCARIKILLTLNCRSWHLIVMPEYFPDLKMLFRVL